MPYINKEARVRLDPYIDYLLSAIPDHATGEVNDGEVNYVITRIINEFYNKPSYRTISRGKAVLADARDEFHDRVMRPLEDQKCKANGDVYQSIQVTMS